MSKQEDARPERSAEYLLGFQRGLIHAIALIKGKIGDETYRMQFWPERYRAKRRLVEHRVDLMRVTENNLTDWLRLAQAESARLNPKGKDQ